MTAFEYAPAPESRAVVEIKPSYGLFIGGEFVDPGDGSSFKSINPSSEEVLAEVAEAGPGDVILFAGKGHEQGQIVGDKVLPFDDVTVAREEAAS